MAKAYVLSDEGFNELVRTHEALNTLHHVLYETEGSHALFKAESFAYLLSFYVKSLDAILQDLHFQ